MITIEHLTKTFTQSDGEDVQALQDISLEIADGDIFGIIGMSGAGKSTLVRCLNMLEKPTSGRIIIDDDDMTTLTQKELNNRRRKIAMIFQQFNLLQQKTCLKNVLFPLEIGNYGNRHEIEEKAKELLDIVGLSEKYYAYPSQLSGGQQQRVAIARALATEPKILLCDEATSALDPQTTSEVLNLIRELHDKMALTVVVITHQMSVVEQICNRVAIIDGGKIAEVGDVSDVFSRPKSAAARHLVYPEGYEEALTHSYLGSVVRIVFDGAEATDEPLIAKMAQDINCAASILYASTKGIGKIAYGNMLLSIPGDKTQVENAINYLQRIPHIQVEVLE